MSGIQHMLLGPTVVSGGAVVNVDVNSGAVNGSGSVGEATVSVITPFDISLATYSAQGYAFDITKTLYTTRNVSITNQEASPTDLFFSPDGTKMYIIGATGDDVNEYTLSTPWYVTTASFVTNFSVASQDINPCGLYFSPDGTRMYVAGNVNDDIFQYSLGTAWSVSTASYVQTLDVGSGTDRTECVWFSPDGIYMYIAGLSVVKQYTLSTAWDISTASFTRSANLTSTSNGILGISFSPDGAYMYVMDGTADAADGFSLSTPWDVSTFSYMGTLGLSSQDSTPTGIYVDPDGTALFSVGATTDRVYQYVFGGFSVATQESNPVGIFFKTDGTKMYIIGNTGDDVNEYNLATAWDATTASFSQLFSIAGQETTAQDIYFSDDGTRMYIIGSQVDEVNQYTLGTAWDISTASFVALKSVTTEEALPTGLFFSPDGSYMFITGSTGDEINRYSLGTAWDVTTATADQVFSVSAQSTNPNAISFNPSGTKMFMLSSVSPPTLYEYALSTAWDLTSASLSQSKAVDFASPTASAFGLYMKQDGSGFFIVGPTNDRVYFYEIG